MRIGVSGLKIRRFTTEREIDCVLKAVRGASDVLSPM